MPRGQYDRAAARKRREAANPQWDAARQMQTFMDKAQRDREEADLEHQLAEANNKIALQLAMLVKERDKVDKLKRLCNTHGLWIE